jgi:hypothetical protein
MKQISYLDLTIGDNRDGAEIPCIPETTVVTIHPNKVHVFRPGCPDITYEKAATERVSISYQHDNE